MKGSFERIDFSLRPAKHAERRMLNDIFRRLRPFGPVENYRYVGLGSLWFSDFALFHRTLGLDDMLSMERDRTKESRFEDNKPFSAIKTDYRDSSVVLPELTWSKPYFVWLDYDDPLSRNMLLDVSTVGSRCMSGTILALTVQSHRAKQLNEAEAEEGGPSALVRFREALGPDAVPADTSEEDLQGWALGRLSQRMFEAQIESALAIRNMSLGTYDRFIYTPICDIEYMDGAKMKTTVGIFADLRDQAKVEQCGFDTLDFLPTTGRSIKIEVPVLTGREIRSIERQLPKSEAGFDLGSVPREHAEKFAKFYRYLPNFAVLEH